MSKVERASSAIERSSSRTSGTDVEKQQEVYAGPAAVGTVGEGQQLQRKMTSRHVAMMCVSIPPRFSLDERSTPPRHS